MVVLPGGAVDEVVPVGLAAVLKSGMSDAIIA
jgi:hypothetical protein